VTPLSLTYRQLLSHHGLSSVCAWREIDGVSSSCKDTSLITLGSTLRLQLKDLSLNTSTQGVGLQHGNFEGDPIHNRFQDSENP
jgi:hypothetical protein